MDVQRFFEPAAPHQHLLVPTASETCDLAWMLQEVGGGRAVVRIVRGSKARTVSDLFDEIGAALQFPYYFGENWDALDECLTDLEWLFGDASILIFADAQQLLDRESAGQFKVLLDILESAARTWAQTEGGSDQPPQPFHVIFQCLPEDEAGLLARMDALGRSLDRLK